MVILSSSYEGGNDLPNFREIAALLTYPLMDMGEDIPVDEWMENPSDGEGDDESSCVV